jgi:SAM-dependent methyltransferase
VSAEPRSPGRVAADDWDRHWADFGELATVSPAKAFRHRLVVEALGAGGPPERVLDIGSGSGDLAVRIHDAFPAAELAGLELSRVGVERARRRLPAARFFERNLLEPGEVEPGLRGWATHAVCSEVLEHVDRPEALLESVRPYLAPGCRLVVTVPAGPVSAFDRHIGHRRHYTARALAETLERSGFRLEWVRGAGFPFFNLYRLAVVARGGRLAADVSTGGGEPPLVARAAMRTFGLLLRLSRSSGTRGWQLVASAVAPD